MAVSAWIDNHIREFLMYRFSFTLVLLYLTSSILSASGGQDVRDGGKYKIGVFLAEMTEKRQEDLYDGIKDFDAKNRDVKTKIEVGNNDTHIDRIEKMLKWGMAAFVILPLNSSMLSNAIELCEEIEIPIVVVNHLPDESFISKIDAFVASNPFDAGVLQIEWVSEKLGGSGNVGIIKGHLEDEDAQSIRNGNNRAIKETSLRIVYQDDGGWERVKGLETAEKWFSGNIILDAVICSNDEMGIGALLASQGVGVADDDILIVGINSDPDSLKFLGKGLDASVKENTYVQGFTGMDTALKILKNESVVKNNWIPYDLVTLENMDKQSGRMEENDEIN